MTNDSERDPLPPEFLGSDYEVIRELGRGGMAVVYLARERSTGRERAIKVIHTKFLGDSEAIARFSREAKLVAQLNHPGIVQIHSVERLDNAGLALVMDRVPGRTVKQIIREDGPMPVERVEAIMDDIANALGYAHARGIVHRDVKPENIFVDETTGHALLADFGIARSMSGETNLTLAGVVIGTPTYMAPEQIDSDVVDGRSDLYSLGIVGWEMLAGRRPWAGESLYKVIYLQKHDSLPSIEQLRPDVPVRLLAAIDGLLEKSPERRWPTAEDFRAQLGGNTPVERWPHMQHIEIGSDDTVIIPRSALARPPLRSRRRRAIARVGPAAAAIALMISATFVFARQQGGFAASMKEITPSRSAPHAADASRPSGASMGGSAAPNGTTSGTPNGTSAYEAAAGVQPASSLPASQANADSSALGAPRVIRMLPPTMAGAIDPNPAHGPTPLVIQSPIAPPDHVSVAAESTALSPPPSAPAGTSRSGSRHFVIAPGAAHTCLLSPEGSAYCWGSNNQGQLGTGGTQPSAGPATVATNVHLSSLAPGLSHTCALTASGAAYCWGDNDRGQLGDGTTATHATPARTTGKHSFVSIESGAEHSCALTADGHVFCWGANAHGQLGDGGIADHSTPGAVSGGMTFTDVAAGWNHACALNDAGAAYCWGSNEAGQLGDGTTIDRPTPTPVQTNVHFIALSGGSAHTCGITASGAAFCWGQNRFGQLGDGGTIRHLTPTAVNGNERYISISAGGVHTCAVTRDHNALCWGRNSYGQLGDGSAVDRSSPVRVSGGHSFTSVSAFGAHTCGTTTSDEMFCWGYNLEGQLGDGTREHRARPVYVEKPNG